MGNKTLQDAVIAPNDNWSGVITPGQTLRIVDLEGKQAVDDFLCYNADDSADRYNAAVTDAARVAAVLLATKISRGQLPSPFTARAVYRNEWVGLTEPRVVQGALECLEEQGWIRREALRASDGGRPTVRFQINPRLSGRRRRPR